MRRLIFIASAYAAILLSCNHGNKKDNALQTKQADTDNIVAVESNVTDKPKLKNPFELHGILDPGMNNMVAFAMQTPSGWPLQQSFTRVWNDSTPVNQVYVEMSSPAGDQTIEFLPYSPYYYTDGPMARQMRQTSSQMGMALKPQPYEMPPMQPLEYIKRTVMPQLAQHGLQVQVSNERTLPGKQPSQNQSELTGYLDGILSNGKKIRIDCIVSLTTTNVNGEIYYNWNALPSITQSTGNLEETYAYVTYARKSVMMNPAWEQQNNQLVQKGNAINGEISRKNAAIVKDYQDYTGKQITETYEERNRSNDKRAEAFDDMIKGEAKYENTETGERLKLSDQYNYVYKDKQGNFYGSNSVIDKNTFDWEELKRVETKKY